jgi:hypothetical protein
LKGESDDDREDRSGLQDCLPGSTRWNHLAAYSAELPGLTGWVSCHPLQPSRRGGDVYYMSACSKDVTARVVLADIAGHEETVSAAAGRLRDALSHDLERWTNLS